MEQIHRCRLFAIEHAKGSTPRDPRLLMYTDQSIHPIPTFSDCTMAGCVEEMEPTIVSEALPFLTMEYTLTGLPRGVGGHGAISQFRLGNGGSVPVDAYIKYLDSYYMGDSLVDRTPLTMIKTIQKARGGCEITTSNRLEPYRGSKQLLNEFPDFLFRRGNEDVFVVAMAYLYMDTKGTVRKIVQVGSARVNGMWFRMQTAENMKRRGEI